MKVQFFMPIVIIVSVTCSADDLSFHYGPPHPGPWVEQTQGDMWPKPKVSSPPNDFFFVIDSNQFQFKLDKFSGSCDIVQAGVQRYKKRFFSHGTRPDLQLDSPLVKAAGSPKYLGVLNQVEIVMNNKRGCEKYPYLNMDEHYEIKVDSPDEPGRARIISFSVWGILRGLESFSQLIYYVDHSTTTKLDGLYQINRTQVMDFPRFPHRGVMLDSSRHFLSMRVLIENLNLMEMNKMNVFHWHLTDDSSFPYTSKTFPNLSARGAYRPQTHVYSQQDVRDIIEEARLRGIRVVSEFDTPGHTQSWELGQPGLLTKCEAPCLSKYGPMNPIRKSVYNFLAKFFKEVTSVFPDNLLHLGGDEVDTTCWESNAQIRQFMKTHNITGQYRLLESYYLKKLFRIVRDLPTSNSFAVWEEVFANNHNLTKKAIIHVWKKSGWEKTVNETTSHGLRVLLSAPWYLNYISYGADWTKYYSIEPLNFGGDLHQQNLVLGGEACMWGEFVNSINLIPRLWPRASAVAERLWSPREVTNLAEAAGRLQEHECRMLQRGYAVEPAIGPSYCDVSWTTFL